jgi:periplasmic protein TonB
MAHIFGRPRVFKGKLMASYRANPSRPDRAKAIAAVVAVHAAIAVLILTSPGTVSMIRESAPTVLVDIKPPPPPPPPQPQPRADRAKEEEGAAGKKAEPTPIVAPKPRIVVPAKPPVVAAPLAGTGASANAGAATAGSGPGAGGSGSGRGGGGSGDFSGFAPARLIRNVSRADYRALAAGRLPSGSAMVSLQVQTNGLPANCRIVRTSGDPIVDSGLCPLLVRRLRFRPARDNQGRAIPYSLEYVATWRL